MRTKRWGIAAAVAALAAVVGLSLAPMAASAQDATLILRQINSEDPSQAVATFVYTGDQDAAKQVAVSVNGSQTQVTKLENPSLGALDGRLAIVVDTGKNMNDGGELQAAKESIKALIPSLTDDGVQVAIWAAGDQARLLQGFTSSEAKLMDALDRMGPSENSALWGSIEQAGKALGDNRGTTRQPNLLVVAGDADTVTQENKAGARGEVIGSGAVMMAVEVAGGNVDKASLDALVAEAGGIAVVADGADQTSSGIESSVSTLESQQYVATFDTGLTAGSPASISLTVGGSSTTGNVVIGGDSVGHATVSQEASTVSSPVGFLQNGFGMVLGLALAAVAVAGGAYALTLLFTDDSELTSVLQPYAEGFAADTDEDESSVMAKSAILQRAVELTEQVAESQGYLARMEGALERANLPLRAAEAIFFYISFVVVMTLLAFVLLRNAVGGLVIGVIAALLPAAILSYMANSRKKKFNAQLPDTLQLLSGTLRAGYSLMQGVEAVSQEVGDPMGIELRRVVTEARLGRPLEESLDSMADRMDSPDFAWAVMAIRIQREVGGNLSELLMTVAETMTARERLRREVAALTAEGRVSAYVLAGLPLALGAVMYTINPDYTGTLFKETLGIVLLILAGIGMLIGFFWMKKIIDIEI